jgi:hypothetical protein
MGARDREPEADLVDASCRVFRDEDQVQLLMDPCVPTVQLDLLDKGPFVVCLDIRVLHPVGPVSPDEVELACRLERSLKVPTSQVLQQRISKWTAVSVICRGA